MKIKINEVEYTLKFGLKFIRELDEKYYFERNGAKFGATLEDRIPLIFAQDPVTLSEFLYSATSTQESRPTRDEVDAYIEECEDIEKLFDEVLSELKNSNVTKSRMKQMETLLSMMESLKKQEIEEKNKEDLKKHTKN